jgi:putative DNA primase/helicase
MTPDDLLACLAHLPDRPPLELLERRLETLKAAMNGGLPPLQRALVRTGLINRLKELHVSGAAALAAAALGAGPEDETPPPQGQDVTPVDFAPSELALEGATILANLVDTFERYVSLPPHASTALALSVVLAHTFEATAVLPLIALVSPTKRCGKSTALMLASALLPRAVLAANITPPAVFRTIEKHRPTLLLDEADVVFRLNDEMRTLFNASHTKPTAWVIRTVGEDYEPRRFGVWCPKWLALIGELPGTLTDRAIVIPMQRRPKDATTQRLRLDRLPQHRVQAETIARWAADHLDALQAADPALPEELNDRQQDNWRPLVAIADLAGKPWPDRARAAAVALSSASDDTNERGSLLLRDLQTIFTKHKTDRLTTAAILTELTALEERPWSDYARGKGITPRQLARLLKPFGVNSTTFRVGETTPKGYVLSDGLSDAFTRYISSTPPKTGSESATSATSAETLTKHDVSDPQQRPFVADGKTGLSTQRDREVADVAHLKPGGGDLDKNREPGEQGSRTRSYNTPTPCEACSLARLSKATHFQQRWCEHTRPTGL